MDENVKYNKLKIVAVIATYWVVSISMVFANKVVSFDREMSNVSESVFV